MARYTSVHHRVGVEGPQQDTAWTDQGAMRSGSKAARASGGRPQQGRCGQPPGGTHAGVTQSGLLQLLRRVKAYNGGLGGGGRHRAVTAGPGSSPVLQPTVPSGNAVNRQDSRTSHMA